MKSYVFASRNTKEILRDPLTLFFGIAFPVILLLLLSAINANIPEGANPSFGIYNLAPGIAVFGLSFVTLFSALLLAKDRSDSLMLRLMTSPMTSWNFIVGYTVPLIPMAILQVLVLLLISVLFGFSLTWNLLLVIVVLLPAILFYISMGLLFGSILSEKQVGGICGALVTNLSAWLSGIWFDTAFAGKAFDTVAHLLPFAHAVDAARSAANGAYGDIMKDLWWVIGYAVVTTVGAVLALRAKMNGKNT